MASLNLCRWTVCDDSTRPRSRPATIIQLKVLLSLHVTASSMLVTQASQINLKSACVLHLQITMSKWPTRRYALVVYGFPHEGMLNPLHEQLAGSHGLCCRSGNYSVQQVVWGIPRAGVPDAWDAV